jgi:hypothetical protein
LDGSAEVKCESRRDCLSPAFAWVREHARTTDISIIRTAPS